jgi:hypothetical protein
MKVTTPVALFLKTTTTTTIQDIHQNQQHSTHINIIQKTDVTITLHAANSFIKK